MTPGPKRSNQEREHDLVIIAKLYFEGKYQSEIAAQLGLTQQQISYDLKKLQKRWIKESMQQITQGKARELAKVDNLERHYWEAFRKSQDRDQDHIGAISHLSGVQWCINKRCQIMGFDAPSKSMSIDVSKLNDDQLQRLAAGEDYYSVIADPGTG